MLVEEIRHGAAIVKIYDDAYINRTEDEINESIKSLTKICSRIQYRKQMKESENKD